MGVNMHSTNAHVQQMPELISKAMHVVYTDLCRWAMAIKHRAFSRWRRNQQALIWPSCL